MTGVRRAGVAFAVLGTTAVLVLTLTPMPDEASAAASTPLSCLVCGDRGGVDVISNILLTIPLGLGVRLLTESWRRAVLAAALLSLTVELLQLTIVPGRDASLSDLVSNTAGGALGASLAARHRVFLRPTRVEGWRLLLGGAVAALALLALSAWLQKPVVGLEAAEADAPLLHRDPDFPGRLTRVRVDGVPLPLGTVAPMSEAQRRGLADGRVTVEVDLVSGPPASGRRGIFHLGETSPRLVLGQQGRGAVFSPPARAVVFRLRPPLVLLRRAFPPDSGVPVELRARSAGRMVRLESSYAGERRTLSVALSPAHGWVLIAPPGVGLGPETHYVTALLLVAGTLALGYWGSASGRGVRAATLLAAAIVAGLGAIPAVGGYLPVHWSQWAAAAAGSAAGWALHRGAAYLQPRCGSPSATVSSSS